MAENEEVENLVIKEAQPTTREASRKPVGNEQPSTSGRMPSRLPKPNSRGRKAPTPQERKFVEGVAEGKTDKAAALDAGYSVSMAENTKYKLWTKPQLQAYFQCILQKTVPPELVSRRISELMEGKSVATKRKRTMGIMGLEEEIIEEVTKVDVGAALRVVLEVAERAGYVERKRPEISVDTTQIIRSDQEPMAKVVDMNCTSNENSDGEAERHEQCDGAAQTNEGSPKESDPAATKS